MVFALLLQIGVSVAEYRAGDDGKSWVEFVI